MNHLVIIQHQIQMYGLDHHQYNADTFQQVLLDQQEMIFMRTDGLIKGKMKALQLQLLQAVLQLQRLTYHL